MADGGSGSSVPPASDQSNEERRRIRKKYRDFIEDMQKNQQDLINPQSDALNERLKEADELFKPVKTSREAVLDSQAMSLIANLGRQKAQALHTEFVKFQPVEFAERLISFMDGTGGTQNEGSRVSAKGWLKLGTAVQPFFKRSPAFHFMLGSFERGPRPQKEPRRPKPKEKDNVVGKETVPQQLKDFNETEKNEATTEEVERVNRLLRELFAEENSPLCYFEFVLNPHSFGQTIENIFYASFLVRDGHASVFLDEDGLPVIKPMVQDQPEGAANKKKEGQKFHQTVFSITPQEWKKLVEVYKITEPTIPMRAHVQPLSDSGEDSKQNLMINGSSASKKPRK